MLIDSRPRSAREPAVEAAGPGRAFAGVRTRVLLSFLALLVVSTAASVFVLREVLLSRIGDDVQEQLTLQVDALQTLEREHEPAPGGRLTDIEDLFVRFITRQAPPADGALIAFVGGELYKAEVATAAQTDLAGAFDDLATSSEPSSGTVETPAGEAQYVAIPVGEGAGVMVAAQLTADERAQVESAVRIAIGVSVVVLLLASLFIWLAAGRALAPLEALSRTARKISETDLSARIPVRGSDELAELGRTFNGMLDRLETAFAGQKDFLSDVSHELRTPITVIRGHLETIGDTPAEREEAIAVCQDELDRMSRYVDDLLLLTKAPRPDFLRPAPVDLDLFTQDVFTKARSLGDRDWRLEGTGVGIVLADEDRLTQAIMNLADNAARHTHDGDPIWLGSSLVGDRARLWVRDEGPGVDPEDRLRIFDRFGRGEAGGSRRRSDGTGLGLSIVRAIAEAHGGAIELDSRAGFGSTFTIVLPAAPAP